MTNRTILSEFKDFLEKEFPGLVSKVILYGSQVTGEAREGSDYDFLVIVKGDSEILWDSMVPKKKMFVLTDEK